LRTGAQAAETFHGRKQQKGESMDTHSQEQSSVCSFQQRCIDTGMPGAGEECSSTRFAKDVKPRQTLSTAHRCHRSRATLVTYLLTWKLTKTKQSAV